MTETIPLATVRRLRAVPTLINAGGPISETQEEPERGEQALLLS